MKTTFLQIPKKITASLEIFSTVVDFQKHPTLLPLEHAINSTKQNLGVVHVHRTNETEDTPKFRLFLPSNILRCHNSPDSHSQIQTFFLC